MRNLGIKNLDLYITGKCNYCCGYCYGENDIRGKMTMETFNKALEFASYIGATHIEFCGGEPLVVSNIEEYAQIALDKGFELVLRTNAMLLNKHFEFVAKNFDWVGISLDGLPKDNDLMRKSRTEISAQEKFDTPINAIFELKKLNPNLKIVLASVASLKNYLGIPAFAKYLIDHNIPIDKWKIYEFIVDKFRSVEFQNQYRLTEEQFNSMVELLPKDINGAPIIAQSAHTDRVSANCLIVKQSGDIDLFGKHYGNVTETDFDFIIDSLLNDGALNVIQKNKEVTYND